MNRNATTSDFPPTRWSVVLTARESPSPASAAALESICRNYWSPLYGYVRRCGKSPHDAEDITQGFFCRLLEKGWLDDADREKGRLRTFLIVALKQFMRNEWRYESTQRRGGGKTHISFDTQLAERRLTAASDRHEDAEKCYDRQWALMLLEITLQRLRLEFEMAGKPEHFEVLKESFLAARGSIDYNRIARRLGMTEANARVATHRIRKRFRMLYRDEIAQTLPDEADIEDEMRHLATALSSGNPPCTDL